MTTMTSTASRSVLSGFRQWMKDRGYRETPLYLSEYGILMPPDYGDPPLGPARVNTYMTRTFDYLTTATSATLGYPADGNRLVQKWSWYSATDQHFNGWLFDSGLSAMGQNYATHTAAIAVENDLAPWRLMTDRHPLLHRSAAHNPVAGRREQRRQSGGQGGAGRGALL